MKVTTEDGYVKVHRDSTLICAAILRDGRCHDLTFMDVKFQQANKTRQAACRLLQKAGF